MIRFEFDGMTFEEGWRLDRFVEGRGGRGTEIGGKTGSRPREITFTYLRLKELPVRLLLHFGAGTFQEGLRRTIIQDQPSRGSA